jgi:very-short-patch-repair endonuclease
MDNQTTEKSLCCAICGHTVAVTLQRHINIKHGIKVGKYQELYPDSPAFTDKVRESSILSNKTRDPSYKKKISENNKRLLKDPIWKERRDKALREANQTPEARENHKKGALKYLSNRTPEQIERNKEAMIGAWKDPIKRANRIEGLQKAHRSEEGRKNHSEAMKKYYAGLSTDERAAIRQNLKDTWAKPENREKIIELAKIASKAAQSPEARENQRLANLKPEVKAKRSQTAKVNSAKLLKSRVVYSGLNKFLYAKMNEINLFPEQEYQIKYYVVDFCFPEIKLVIEAQGDYWHANPEFMKERKLAEPNHIQKKMIRNDKAKDTYLKNHGWTVLYFWERDIHNKTDACLEEITNTIQRLKNECSI